MLCSPGAASVGLVPDSFCFRKRELMAQAAEAHESGVTAGRAISHRGQQETSSRARCPGLRRVPIAADVLDSDDGAEASCTVVFIFVRGYSDYTS